ncbi:MFS transporter [Paraburkholderia ginsengiterrae]|uniref:MFS transporter n=1 Tax=Paraburkholderia ginsengiterrae TaxID=1462993 RepID=UPI0009EDCEA1|nr:MFS transporter [Paraburkholderia ginsengiterrae]
MQAVIPTPTGCSDEADVATFRWVVLFFAWAGLMLSTVCRLAWGTLALPAGQSLGLPIAALGVFVTAFYVGYVLSNVVGGVTTDRIGGRATLSVSLLGLAFATFCFGYTPSLAVGLVLQCVMGLTAGADYAAGVKLVSTWFARHERGRAVGLLMSASSMAVIVTNAVLPGVATNLGWRNTYHGLGICALVLSVLTAVIVRNHSVAANEQAPERGAKNLRAAAFLNRNFILLGLAGCGGFWGTLGFASWAISLMVKGHHMAPVQAGFIVAIAGVAGLASKPSIGWLSDRLGGRRKALTVVSFLFFFVALLMFGQLSDLGAFRFAAPFIGIGAFVYSPLLVTLVAEQSGINRAGSAAGIANAVWQSGSAMSPAVVGLVFQATHSFQSAFATLALGPLLGAICMLFVKEQTGQ